MATLRGLGVPVDEEATVRIRDRLDRMSGPAVGDVASVVNGALANAPSRMLCASLDDLAVASERPNIPGAPAEHPNWFIAMPEPIEVVFDAPIVDEVSAELNRVARPRRRATGPAS